MKRPFGVISKIESLIILEVSVENFLVNLMTILTARKSKRCIGGFMTIIYFNGSFVTDIQMVTLCYLILVFILVALGIRRLRLVVSHLALNSLCRCRNYIWVNLNAYISLNLSVLNSQHITHCSLQSNFSHRPSWVPLHLAWFTLACSPDEPLPGSRLRY